MKFNVYNDGVLVGEVWERKPNQNWYRRIGENHWTLIAVPYIGQKPLTIPYKAV